MELGVCYYPEQWPRERWATDAAMMAAAGLRSVRIGEFAWAAYEPARNRFEWGWLDEAIETLAAAGLRIILGTPTATPPIWLAVERPKILAVDVAGYRKPYGSRRHTCPTAADYRDEARRVVSALVERYGGHEAVEAWQIDNEPGNHDSARCWCDECEDAFTRWLAARYGTIADLNEAWGTVFWSQVYPDFDAVLLPRPAPTAQSPSLRLAHMRFASTQVLAGLEEQAQLIRAGSPGRDITVNFYAGDTFIDYRAAARIGGIGAIDSYPHGAASADEVRFWHDLARGISGTNRGWIMEQQPGAINWTAENPPVADGQVRQWLEDAAADGIERTLLFRWRAALAGQEQYHTGMLRHDGTADRAHDETAKAAPTIGTMPRPEAATTAIVYEYEDAWALDIEPHQAGLTHRALVVSAHAAARRLGTVDVVGWDDDLAQYTTLLVPAAILGDESKSASLLAAAAAGTTVVVGPRTFTRTADLTAFSSAVPAHVAPEIGCSVVEGLSLPTDDRLADGAAIGPWLDVIDPGPATVLERHAGPGHLEGAPAATVTPHGKGRIVIMGASSTEAWTSVLHKLHGPNT